MRRTQRALLPGVQGPGVVFLGAVGEGAALEVAEQRQETTPVREAREAVRPRDEPRGRQLLEARRAEQIGFFSQRHCDTYRTFPASSSTRVNATGLAASPSRPSAAGEAQSGGGGSEDLAIAGACGCETEGEGTGRAEGAGRGTSAPQAISAPSRSSAVAGTRKVGARRSTAHLSGLVHAHRAGPRPEAPGWGTSPVTHVPQPQRDRHDCQQVGLRPPPHPTRARSRQLRHAAALGHPRGRHRHLRDEHLLAFSPAPRGSSCTRSSAARPRSS